MTLKLFNATVATPLQQPTAQTTDCSRIVFDVHDFMSIFTIITPSLTSHFFHGHPASSPFSCVTPCAPPRVISFLEHSLSSHSLL